jgi:hypothetical protein
VGPRPLAPQRRHREHRGFPPHHALQKALAAEDHLQLLPHHGLRLVFGYSRLSAPTSSVCLSRASAFFSCACRCLWGVMCLGISRGGKGERVRRLCSNFVYSPYPRPPAPSGLRVLLPGFAAHPKLVAATALGVGLNFWRGKQWVLKGFWAGTAAALALARLAPDFASNQGVRPQASPGRVRACLGGLRGRRDETQAA